MISPHAIKRAHQRSIPLDLVEKVIQGTVRGVELRGKEELALPQDDGTELVVKFHNAARRVVATVYIRDADQVVKLVAERKARRLPVKPWPLPSP